MPKKRKIAEIVEKKGKEEKITKPRSHKKKKAKSTTTTTLLDKLTHELECTVCYESYDVKERLPILICSASHTFCSTCIQQLVRATPYAITCPTCRKVISVPSTGFQPNTVLRSILEFMPASSSSHQKKKKKTPPPTKKKSSPSKAKTPSQKKEKTNSSSSSSSSSTKSYDVDLPHWLESCWSVFNSFLQPGDLESNNENSDRYLRDGHGRIIGVLHDREVVEF